ncbi:hypothetical protein JCM19232_1064 [Vibrio ishigakensis]|uniref:Recombinase domain-containing protein n=1 Tax=Vibrio ishigakensis TaxID=1481914 RepID=A0A0B8PNY6_9VIBR|nr:hypothetical protein JCM19232_1064 [Vibrio ishigakensis]
MKTCDSLVRVSTKKQSTDTKTGLVRQSDNVQSWLSRNPDYELRNVIELKGVSGFSGKHLQGEFGSYLDDLENNVLACPDAFLVDEMSRLTRLPLQQGIALVNRFSALGVTLVFVAEGQTYSPSSSDDLGSFLALTVRLHQAHEESQRKSRMLRSARLQETKSYASGGLVKNRLPNWITISDNQYVVDEVKADAIRYLHKLYQSNHTYSDILKIFKAESVPVVSIRSRDWSTAVIKNLLTASTTYGLLTRNHADREPQTFENHFPAVISKECYDLTQALIASKKGTRSGGVGKNFNNIFRGCIVCADCGYSVSVKRNSQGRVYMSCEGRNRRGYTVADCKNGGYLQQTLIARVLYILKHERLVDSSTPSEDLPELRLQLSTQQAEYTKFKGRLALIDEDLLPEFQQELRNKKQLLSDLENRIQKATVTTGTAFDLDAELDNLSRIDITTPDGRRNLNKHLSRRFKFSYSTTKGLIGVRALDSEYWCYHDLEGETFAELYEFFTRDAQEDSGDGSEDFTYG